MFLQDFAPICTLHDEFGGYQKFCLLIAKRKKLDTNGRFRLCPSQEERRHYSGADYVERRSLWVEKVYKNNPLSDFEYFNERKFGLLTKVWVKHFGRPKLCSRGRTLGAITS